MTREEHPSFDDSRKSGWETSKLRKLKTYTYVQNKLEALMKKDPILVSTLSGKRFDLKDPSRDDYDLAMALCLVQSGKLTDEEIHLILRNFFSHGRGSEAPKDYFDRIINRAHETLNSTHSEKSTPTLTYEYRKFGSLKDNANILFQELKKREERHDSRKKNFSGYDTGFQALNAATGGFQEGSLIVLSGPQGTGKTSFALQCAAAIAGRERLPCLFAGYEQPFIDLYLICASQRSGIPHSRLSLGSASMKEMKALQDTFSAEMEAWGEFLFIVEGDDNLTPVSLRTHCEEQAVKVLIVDSTASIPTSAYPTQEARIHGLVSHFSRMAVELKMAVVLLHTHDERISPSAFSLCDVLISIHERAGHDPAQAERVLRIDKNRLGPSGITISFKVNAPTFTFSESR